MLKKILRISICMLLIFGFFAREGLFFAYSNADDGNYEYEISKIYCKATIDDDFAENRIIVVLNNEVSLLLRDYELEDFKEIDATKVTDLTDSTKSLLKLAKEIEQNPKKYTDEEIESVLNTVDGIKGYNQILSIELRETGKDKVLEAIKEIEGRSDCIYTGPDYRLEIMSTTPNDSNYGLQWAASKIQLPAAWDITTGSSTVNVGILDTGIDSSHPDLSNRINTSLSRNFGSGRAVIENPVTDLYWHGTHVAGIIGAQGNNSIGVCGVAWNVSLVSLKIFDETGSSYSSYATAAIDFATSNNIPILNMSCGWEDESLPYYNISLATAIANYPGLFICSAGNYSSDLSEHTQYPSEISLPNMIVVANTDSNDSLAGSSNYGSSIVHLAAPGQEILSTSAGHQYVYASGTSMAAPCVTGVAALIKSIRPELSAMEIKTLILDNVDKITSLNGKCITGGRLNAYKAVRAASEPRTFSGDVNGDGRADVILVRKISGNYAFTVYRGKTDAGFEEPVTTQGARAFSNLDSVKVGDFNGDGRSDVAVIHRNSGPVAQLSVYLGNANGLFSEGTILSSSSLGVAMTYPGTIHVGDVDGNGKDDIIYQFRNPTGTRSVMIFPGSSTNPYLINTTSASMYSANTYLLNAPAYVGDTNGDGKDDLVVQWAQGGYRQLLTYIGNSSGTFNTGANLSSTRRHDLSQFWTKNFIADVNGDGKDDFIVHWKNTSGYRNNLVYKGKTSSPYLADATTNALTSSNSYRELDPVFVGDIDGDGCSDMIVHWTSSAGKRQLLVYRAKSDGTYYAGVNYATTNANDPSVYAGTFFVDDVNGDGRDDFIVKWKSSDGMVRLLVYKGTSSGSFTTAVKTTPSTNIPYYQ